MDWEPLVPADAARLMAGYDRPWWVGGGWALDLFLDRTTRPHDDLDVVVLRDEQQLVRAHFANWDLHVAHQGTLTPWHGERLELPLHVIWCRPDPGSPWQLELLLMEARAGRWHFRRDPRITLELDRVGLVRDGIPHLAPEIPLLYKSKEPRDRDEADFAAVLPELSPDRRSWLRAAIESQEPAHPWVEALGG